MTFDKYLAEALKDEKLRKEYQRLSMKKVIVMCPNCRIPIQFKNWFHWVWHCPFHWFGKRLVKCPHCGEKRYMKVRKPVVWKSILTTNEWFVDYDKNNKVYRVSYFENGHFVDECKFTAKH